MKKIISLKLLYIFFSTFLILSCKSEKKSSDSNSISRDTITTASGLQYFYNAKGTGRKIEKGSKISAILSLKVNDNVIWTTYSSKDSIFSNIAGVGEVIKGYDEMSLLLREGDDVVAIMPSNIAYGEGGSGEMIPPNSTLIYNQFKITAVSEPRLLLSDTLFTSFKEGGIELLKNTYNQATKTTDSTLYHGGIDQLDALWRNLTSDEMYAEANEIFTFFKTKLKNTNSDFYVIRSLENQGKIQQAIEELEFILKSELTADQKEYYLRYKQDLRNKL